MLAAGWVMNRLDALLRSLRVEGQTGGGLGQLPFTRGVGHGSDAARETVGAWVDYAAVDPDAVAGTTLAFRWLAVDSVVFALLGYVLASVAVLLLARWARRDTTDNAFAVWFHRFALVGIAVGAIDLVENILAWRVVGAAGAGPAGALFAVTVVKWIVVAVFLIGMGVTAGRWLWTHRTSLRLGRGGPVADRRLRAWGRSMAWNLAWLVVTVLLLALTAGGRVHWLVVAMAAVAFIAAAYRFNATLEQRRRSDEPNRNIVTTRLVVGGSLLVAGATVAVGHQWTGSSNGVGFVGFVAALFGASGLLGELRWSRWWRPWLGLAVLGCGAVLAAVALWAVGHELGVVLLVVAVFVFGVVGLSLTAEDVLRWLSEPTTGATRGGVWAAITARLQRQGDVAFLALGLVLVAVTVAWMMRADWGFWHGAYLLLALVLLAVGVGSNWAAEAAIASAGVALVWSLLPSSAEPAGFLEVEPDDERVLVVLGDSYTSGEGADTYYEGTNTSERSRLNKCRRAPTAYGPQLLMKDDLGFDSLLFLACSGAEIEQVITKPQYPGEPVGGEPPGTSQLAQAVETELTLGADDVVLVGIGGNDAGFGDVIGTCLAPGDCSEIADRLLEPLRTIEGDLVDLYGQVRGDLGDGPRLVAVPYPVPIADSTCAESFFTDDEHRLLNAFTQQLNQIVRSAASRAGIEYAEEVETALAEAGAGLCMGGELGVNYVTLSQEAGALEEQTDVRNWLHNSMHPNPTGHELVADALATRLASSPEEVATTSTSTSADPHVVPDAVTLLGAEVAVCTDGPDQPELCRVEGTEWVAAQFLASVRRHLAITLLAFSGISLATLGALLFWRRRLLLGSYRWVSGGGGRLVRHERRALMVPLVTALFSFVFDAAVQGSRKLIRSIVGRNPRSDRPSDQPTKAPEPFVPSKQAIDEADKRWQDIRDRHPADEQHLERCDAVRAHSWRAYQYGLALAGEDAVPLDPDRFYLAAMFHDVGLLAPDEADDEPPCFTKLGADLVHDALTAIHRSDGAVVEQDGIVNHITPSLTLAHDEATGVYLQQGSLLDLTGQRRHRLPGGFHDAVTEAGSGDSSHAAIVIADLWDTHAEQVAAGRARYANCCGGLFTRIVRWKANRG